MPDNVKKLPNGLAPWLLLALIALVAAYVIVQKTNPPGASEAETTPLQGGISVEAGSEEDFMVNVGRRIFFAEGSAALDETALMTLDKQVEWLNKYPQWKVKLQGSADDPGDAQAQIALSQKRAEAVRDYLASQGIAPERLLAKGYGRDKIGTDCPEIECQSQNRRVITNLQETPEF
ncbi:OmpA family protein [Aestuariivirga sp. YIM B02566]|uniref:OmpA family protein n=1 Tax=Taklimakanibacter albus TaxID=2800327 RepID=A0ACC5RF69_9HYPH|nr:OmpA family protein [Aestuariivirga sp. YIM B02566]MBK1871364.1 OmpA family protein [Aestuariivirga sp. YIM B02566]